MSQRILIVGGNAAGMTAASRAKRLDPSLSVTIVEASRNISYSICGLPYCLEGRVQRFEELVYFTPETLKNQRGIEALTETRAVEILPGRKTVAVEHVPTRRTSSLSYDKLLVATGYRPRELAVEGLSARGVFTASRIEDGEAIASWLRERRPQRAVLIGGGYVGLEMAEALRARGLMVTLVEQGPSVFVALDPEMSARLEQELESRGVRVLTGHGVARLRSRADGSVEAVELAPGSARVSADLVFVDVGVQPRVELAARAGIRLGRTGAIEVSERMETSQSSIYAAGNCAETLHRVSGRPVLDALGTVAAKQGRVAGENMAGRVSRFSGAVGTAVVKVFGLTAARAGLSSTEARQAGFHVKEASIEGRFQASYFDEAGPARVKVIADSDTRRLLGAQIVGGPMAAVRIDTIATALTAGMTVDEVAQLDLAYAPPVGTLWSPLLVAMNVLLRRWNDQ